MSPEPQPIRVTISAPGDGDLAVVNAHRRLHGMPASTLQWSCQHSCAPETIPTCTDANCDASCRLSDEDIAEIRRLVERADLAAFDDVRLDYTVSAPADEIDAMSAVVPKSRASLLALARFAEGTDSSSPLREATADALRSHFYYAARALLDQRVVDRRTSADSDAFVVFTTNGDFPKVAYVATGVGQECYRFDTVIGLDDDHGICFGTTKAGASRVPGDQYGPRRRLIVRVDNRTLTDVRARVDGHVAATAGQDPGAACLACFVDLAKLLGLPAVQPDTDIADPFLRASRYLGRLMRAIPL